MGEHTKKWEPPRDDRPVPLGELIHTAVLAERSEVFESVWFGDSLIHKPRLEAITMLAAVATHTKRVRLGTICMASFPVRRPVLLAIQWASLDQLSQGRSLLGVCIGGGHESELRAFGIKKEERVGRMREGIELLRQIWSDQPTSFRGKYYTLEDYNIVPKPVQKSPPIWIAVSPDREQVGDKIVDQAMRRVGLPMGDVVSATDRVAAGDFSARVAERGPPFLRGVARAFNSMTARLQEQDRQRRDLMADIAHELRTPLAVVQGRIEGLLDGVYPRDDARLSEVLEETRLLARLVEDLGTLAHSERGTLGLQ